MISIVDESNLFDAAAVHAAAWRESHRTICSAAFVEAHTTERQMAYISSEIIKGKSFFVLTDNVPVAVVSINGNDIADLYVHPSYQHQGYGTKMLQYAIAQCPGQPSLCVLNTNTRAIAFYMRFGFKPTGKRNLLSDTLYEVEMLLQ